MALTSGTRLGPYEILLALGAGGMGEVYRARDARLARDVALKLLPDTFTLDPERLARFRREAQLLASLNHPHIGAIYGLEEVNEQQFLVLELVDGESLDKRIARGPIPVDEALAISTQIAEALEAAHEKGIIHRDLKPANIALTGAGTARVLDFGLAKATEASGATVDLVNSPTITTTAMMTGVGTILGTAAYMSLNRRKGSRRTSVPTSGRSGGSSKEILKSCTSVARFSSRPPAAHRLRYPPPVTASFNPPSRKAKKKQRRRTARWPRSGPTPIRVRRLRGCGSARRSA